MKRQSLRTLAVCLGLCGVLALVLVPAAWADGMLNAAQAPAALRNYPGSAPCNTTLQACLSGSNAGDIVNVAANTYVTAVLVITKSIVLQGAGAAPGDTRFQANGAHTVISVAANIAAGVVISNLRVFSGTTSTFGAGIFADSGTPLTLQNMEVLSNTNNGNSGGGIFVSDALTLTNVNVSGNNDPGGAGGGLRAAGAGRAVNIVGGRFERNTSFNPGGAMRVNGPLTLTNVTIISNSITSVTQDGGGIRADGGLFMQGGLVQNNTAGNNGGGIAASSAVLSATQLISNTANNGGGILVNGALAVTNTLLDKNVARTGNGGSIFASNSGITITLAGNGSVTATVVSNSTALTNGGGVFAAGNVVLVGNVSFNLNHATNGDGGGIYAINVSDASAGLINPLIGLNSNSASLNGGGIRATGNVLLTTFPSFVGNHTLSPTGDGGAIYADGNVTVASGFSQANGARNGGLIYSGGNVSVKQHAVSQSNASQDGGCVYAAGNLEVLNDEFSRCSAGRNGGAFFAGQTVTITGAYNGTVIQAPGYQLNAAARGALVFGSNVILRSVAPFSNTASVEGGAVSASSTADISATSFTSNTAGTAGGAVVVSGAAWITSSIFSVNRVTGTVGFGGAVWVTGTAAITNSTFLTNNTTLNTSAQGGAVGATGRLTLLGDSFQGNQATTGGAVRGLADVFATNSSFTGNGGINDRQGGGIAALTVTVSGVTMTQNTVCCTNASGGAISATVANISNSVFIQNSSFISGGAVIATQVFITGSQFLTNANSGGEGGAVWTRGGVISTTQFTANSTSCCSGAAGGAVFAQGQLKVYSSQFTGNQSNHGGALFLHGSQSEVHDSTFTGNFVNCCDGGGAIDAVAFFPAIYNSIFSGNHVDCCEGGGAIRATDLLYVEASTFSNNSADTDGGAIQRLVASNNTTFITASTFISNFAGTSGGAVFGKQADIENSTFISNHVASLASGGALSLIGSSTIAGDSFTANRVDVPVGACGSGLGGAIFQDQSGSVSVLDSSFARNSGPRGGALFTAGGGSIEQSSFSDNSAFCLDSVTLSNIGSGGAVDSRGFLSVKRSAFVHNSAGSLGGGGIAFLPSSANALHVENSLFARNVATNTVFGAEGAAIVISESVSTAQLFFNTFADQPRNPVSAIAGYSGTLSAVDNIITGHATGIKRLGGTAFEDFNLFFDDGVPTSGGVTSGGSDPSPADPLFVAPGGDYHLQFASPAKDQGSDLGITVDFDGDARPIGPKVDIGFDERPFLNLNNFLYLPLIMR